MSEPRWLAHARGYIGLAEIHGPRHNSQILKWWKLNKLPFTDDETPWCQGFVGGVFEELGIRSTRAGTARSNLKWGVGLKKPAVGAVVVFSRGPTQGHVGFVVGKDRNGNIMVLGGNQGDAVNIKPFSTSRVLGYRWPSGEPLPDSYDLPLVSSNGQVSTRESFVGQTDGEEASNDFETLDNATWDDEPPKTFWQKAKNWFLGGGFASAGIGTSWFSGVEPITIAMILGFILLIVIILLITKRI